MKTRNDSFAAYVAPFAIFLGGLALSELIAVFGGESGLFWLAEPKYWVYPLQTVACTVCLIWYWRTYSWSPIVWGFGILTGVIVFILWVSPQLIFGMAPRTEGFNPDLFGESPFLYWMTVITRVFRLVVIVPLVEEIFWRGFLMRYLIKEDFEKVKFGTYSHLSFFGVAVAFMLVHQPADWPAAFISGIIFGWVVIRTKSLFAVVLSHAVANLLLGAYIMQTKQWGFW